MQYCFWDPSGEFGFGDRSNLVNPEEVIFGQTGSLSTWATSGVGNVATRGSWMGAYKYVYTTGLKPGEPNVETGTYGLSSIIAPVSLGNIFVGNWLAATGPYANSWGTAMYMHVGSPSFFNGYFGKKINQAVFGFFCNPVSVAGGWITGECDSELMQGPSIHELLHDKASAQELLKVYGERFPKSFDWKGPDPLYYFKKLYSQIWIHK